MGRRFWFWILASILLVPAIGFGAFLLASRRDQAAFEEQLRLARAEGLPTTAAEFAAQIEPARPEENAAPIYRRIAKRVRESRAATSKGLYEQGPPGRNDLVSARATIDRFAPVLRDLEAAAAMPRCWLDRDWSLGAAVLMPELSDMRLGARLCALRGSIAAAEGRSPDAIREIERIQRIAAHAAEEPTLTNSLVADYIYSIAMQTLARWSFATRQPVYAESLRKAIRAFPRPNLQREWSGELLNLLSLMDLCETKEGRDRLGLQEEDIPPGQEILGLLTSKAKARIEIVRARRAYWSALRSGASDREERMRRATEDVNRALFAFPTAALVYGALGAGDYDQYVDRLKYWEARRLAYIAAHRALSQEPVPKSIRTGDLKSPFDGKPIRYEYDGTRMSILVSKDGSFDDTAFRLTLRSARDE